MRRLTERWRDGFDPVITGYGPAPWPGAARQSPHIYEQQGLMVARREANGYRDYDEPTCGSSARSGPPGAQEPPSELLALTAARALPMPPVGGGQHDARRCLARGNRPARTTATWRPASAATRMSDQTMGANLAGDGPEAVPPDRAVSGAPTAPPAAAPRRSLPVSREAIRHDALTGCRAPVGPEPAAGRLEAVGRLRWGADIPVRPRGTGLEHPNL
jgi:hypothetical protein